MLGGLHRYIDMNLAIFVTQTMSNSERDDDHLKDLEDGAGCTEIWETLSENRARNADD